ncbi:MAG: porin [Capnocytophaga sp.]|nr:porin [Capnocytophaga sp.]
MRTKIITLLWLAIGITTYAQQNDTDNTSSKSLLERVQDLEKRNEKFNVYFNFQSSFDAADMGDGLETAFKARQLRLEMRGNLTEKLFYRFRHRLNRSNAGQSLDNLSRATDMMYAGYRVSDKLDVIFGKQCQSWGGFEFDLNPMNIYEYSDFIEYMDNFMLGINFVIKPNPNHEFQIQITDTRNSRFSDLYGNIPNIETSQSPLTYIVNWNGNLFGGLWQTRWAAGLETEAKNNYSRMLTIGNKLNLSNFQLALDYMYANQDIDRLGIATEAADAYLVSVGETVFKDVEYNTLILKAEYQPDEQWNIFAKGMYETTDVENIAALGNNFRKSYGYFAGLEFKPFEEEDLRLFLVYVGRKYDFNTTSALADYNTNRISVGMMYRIKAF